MNLDNLRTSISKLSDDDLIKLIREIRTSRRTPKTQPTNTKTKVAKSTNPVNLEVLMTSLSPEQLAQLIDTLEAQK
jgi:hypothetical protein